MKLISLNTFGGTFFEPLMAYIREEASDTDIFCFQEILDTKGDIQESMGARANLFAEISEALPGFNGFFSPVQMNFVPAGPTDDNIEFGLAIFINKNIPIHSTGNFFLYGQQNALLPSDITTLPTEAQYVQFFVDKKMVTVCNVHGTAWPGDKLDSSIRLEQTRKILAFVNNQPGEKIICGDFNLFPNTRSVEQFEESGFCNLIKEYNIQTTRGSLIKKIHPEYANTPGGFQEFADYTFVTPGISVTSFDVPDLPISDHLPMVVEFDVK